MKRLIFSLILTLFIGSALTALPAFGYVLDGDLSDWGVTPFTDWVPDSPNIDWTEEDDTKRADTDDPFYEWWDIEAMYFDDDPNYFYFAIVTSNHYINGWGSEDMGVDLNADGDYEFGVNIAPTNMANAFNNNTGVWDVDTWAIYRGHEYRVLAGTKLDTYPGAYDLYKKYAGPIEADPFPDTWILEGRLDRLLFGAPLPVGTPVELHLTRITCLKDWMTVSGTINTTIPEPATVLLLGGGILGLSGLRRRKKV